MCVLSLNTCYILGLTLCIMPTVTPHLMFVLWQTYTGNILIAINPFQKLPDLYSAQTMQHYKGAPLGELSPHVFAVADAAYRLIPSNLGQWLWFFIYIKESFTFNENRAMINEMKSNSILVSGESGAGKTETTKMLMHYLAFLGGRAATTEDRTVEQQVLKVWYWHISSLILRHVHSLLLFPFFLSVFKFLLYGSISHNSWYWSAV